MKLFYFIFSCLGLLACSLSATSGQQSSFLQNESQEVDSTWPGLKFKIVAVKRIDAQNMVIVIRLVTDAKAPNSTYVGFWTTPAPASSGNIPGSRQPIPFSLMKAFVVDQATHLQFSAVPQRPDQPRYGATEIVTTMHPGAWLQMSVQFEIPVPPPNPDGTLPVQKVDVTLPQSKGPIKGVVVPPLTGK